MPSVPTKAWMKFRFQMKHCCGASFISFDATFLTFTPWPVWYFFLFLHVSSGLYRFFVAFPSFVFLHVWRAL